MHASKPTGELLEGAFLDLADTLRREPKKLADIFEGGVSLVGDIEDTGLARVGDHTIRPAVWVQVMTADRELARSSFVASTWKAVTSNDGQAHHGAYTGPSVHFQGVPSLIGSPPMSLQSEIQALVSKFAADLEALVRSAAVEAVTASFGGAVARALPSAVSASKKPGPKPKASTPRVNVEKAAAPKPSPKITKRGTARVRRSAEDIAALGEQIAAFVAKNPGSNAETIKAELKIESKHWGLAIASALDSKKITRKGDRRAAKYSPAGAATIAKPAPVPPIKRAK